ncbi:MAG: carboxypeptidase regulatory-like domain-containing protein [Deltaproteobacteria bacterium]|nr:carboxypeptidase regulatory-like domain-containing protein [Deltaproteobacteria bacterium]
MEHKLSSLPSATYRGQVNTHDGKPLAGMVRVFCGDSPVLNRKMDGQFLLNLVPGPYRIEIRVDGYQSMQHQITLHAQQGISHQFVMNPQWRPDARAPGDQPEEN